MSLRLFLAWMRLDLLSSESGDCCELVVGDGVSLGFSPCLVAGGGVGLRFRFRHLSVVVLSWEIRLFFCLRLDVVPNLIVVPLVSGLWWYAIMWLHPLAVNIGGLLASGGVDGFSNLSGRGIIRAYVLFCAPEHFAFFVL